MRSRQEDIIRYLSNQKDYVAVKHIADVIHVSTKTIYRELEALEKLDSFEIIRKPGYGIKLVIADDTNSTTEALFDSFDSSSNRRKEIILEFLKNSNQRTSIQRMSEQYYVSQTSIINDLKHIKPWFEKYGIQLESSNLGTWIDSDETSIRNAYNAALITLFKDNPANIIHAMNRIDASTFNVLASQFGAKRVTFVEKIVTEAEKCLGFEIVDPYFINLITHTLILIERLVNGNPVKDLVVNTHEIRTHYLTVASMMAKRIEDEYVIKVPDNETLYIYQHLDSIGGNFDSADTLKRYEEHLSTKISLLCETLILNMSEAMSVDFNADTELKAYLLVHLHAVINRQKYRIDIHCPLKNMIFKEYYDLLVTLREMVDVSMNKHYPMYRLSDDECCYLALYFQTSLEKKKECKPLRAIVVCSSGVGTSQLVVTRLRNHYPDLEIVNHIAVSQLDNGKLVEEGIDFVISTIKVDESVLAIPIVYISVLVSQMDQEIVAKQIENLRK